jgi:hypothetical protein
MIGINLPLAPINKCIYCGSTEKLTDEHIIPYGLKGTWVLPKSSCLECNKITSKFERIVLQDELGAVRYKGDFPSRHRSGSHRHLNIQYEKNGSINDVQVEKEDYVTILSLPEYSRPGYFRKENKSSVQISAMNPVIIGDLWRITQKLSTKTIRVTTKMKGTSFERMLLKIGYSAAIAEFGMNIFSKIFVLPSIMGEKNDVGLWVGSIDNSYIGKQFESEHIIEFFTFQSNVRGFPETVLKAHIHLFVKIAPVSYLVLVGTIANENLLK